MRGDALRRHGEAEVGRAGCQVRRVRLEFASGQVMVDVLLAEVHRPSPISGGGYPQAKRALAEGGGGLDVAER